MGEQNLPPDHEPPPSSFLGSLWLRYAARVCRPPEDPPLSWIGVLRRYGRVYLWLWLAPFLWLNGFALEDWLEARIPGWPDEATFLVMFGLMAAAFVACVLTLPIPDGPAWKKLVCIFGGYMIMLFLPNCGHNLSPVPDPRPDSDQSVEPEDRASPRRSAPVPAASVAARRGSWPARRELSPLYSTSGGQHAAAPFVAPAGGSPRIVRWEGAWFTNAPPRESSGVFDLQIHRSAGNAPAPAPIWKQRVRAESMPIPAADVPAGKYGFHAYFVTLENGPSLTAGEIHWLSIAAVDNPVWLWARASLDPKPGLALRKGSEPWEVPARQGLPAFQIEFTR